MPRIPENWLDCSIYLYPSFKAAKDGEDAGGSGFLACVASRMHSQHCHLYAVTNSHMVNREEGNSPVIRLNNKKGESEIVPLTHDDWEHHPDGDDVAIAALELEGNYKFTFVLTRMFVTKAMFDMQLLGVGEDTCMVGRFFSHDGKQRNLPTARFGSIAMLPLEPIENEKRGIMQESFLVETHSISGFSGSPVFVMRETGTNVVQNFLLGIDWGHLYKREHVIDRRGDRVSDDYWIEANSGMSTVVPAWRIMDLLDMPKFVKQREKRDQRYAEAHQGKLGGVTLDSQPHEDKPFTEEDFEQAL